MPGFSELVSSDAVYVMGWILIHSLWIACVPAIVLFGLLRCVPTRYCNTRYLISCLGMIAMVVGIALGSLIVPERMIEEPLAVAPLASTVLTDQPDTATPDVNAESRGEVDPLSVSPNSGDSVTAADKPSASRGTAAIQPNDAASGDQGESPSASWTTQLVEAAQPWVAWLVPAWLIGVVAMTSAWPR